MKQDWSGPGGERKGGRVGLSRWWNAQSVLATVSVVILALSVGFIVYRATDRPEAEGKRLYESNCSACHGDKGGRIPEIPLNSPEFMARLGAEGLTTVVAQGVGIMPAWGREREGPLSSEQISAIVEYLLAPEGLTATTGPGRSLYLDNCAECHGEMGSRIPAVPLHSASFLSTLGDEALTATIRDGKNTMLAFGREAGGPLSDEQVAAVVNYLHALSGGTASGSRAQAPPGVLNPVPEGAAGLFQANCAMCHATLSLPQVDPTSIEVAIREGVPAKGMPGWADQLSDEEIGSLVQLIASGEPVADGASVAAADGTTAADAAEPLVNPFSGVVRHVDGWITKHPPFVKDNGSQLCYKCHQISFCTTCHKGGAP